MFAAGNRHQAKLALSVSALALFAGSLSAATALHAAPIAAAPEPMEPASDAQSHRADIVVSGKIDPRDGPGTAGSVAPSQGSLDAGEPVSIIGSRFIHEILPPGSDWVAALVTVPGAAQVGGPNGPGAGETKVAIRGFQDGQYAVTYDGIPYEDQDSASHHSTAFFPSSTIDRIVVDRGPGYASNLGFATFGGNVAFFSPDLNAARGGNFQASTGSFNTQAISGYLQSGAIEATGGTRIMAGVDYKHSDGALQLGHFRSTNYLVKLSQPLGPNFVLTAFTSINRNKYTDVTQPNAAQIAQFGKYYARLNNDPTSPFYQGYTFTPKQTDFSYIGVAGSLGSFKIDDKVYSFHYQNHDHQLNFAELGLAGSAIGSDIPGINSYNVYRVTGNTFAMTKEFKAGLFSGVLKFGLWAEHSHQVDSNQTTDITTGFTPYQDVYTVPAGASAALTKTILANQAKFGNPSTYQIDAQTESDTIQPFIEFEWKPLSRLSLIPGFKYVDYHRYHQANVDRVTKLPNDSSMAYTVPLPLFTLRYKATDNFTVYAQAAKGWQVPAVADAYISTANVPSPNRTPPATTWNYQAGFVYKTGRFTIDGDIYKIDFGNLTQTTQDPTNIQKTIQTSLGGVTYKGLEGEMTYVLGYGLSAFASGSVSSAKASATGLWISETPSATAALGLILNAGGFSGSVTGKYTGPRYAGSQSATQFDNRMAAYTIANATIGYKFTPGHGMMKSVKVTGGVSNIFDFQGITDQKGFTSAASTTYTFQPPRSFFVSLGVGY